MEIFIGVAAIVMLLSILTSLINEMIRDAATAVKNTLGPSGCAALTLILIILITSVIA